VGNGELESELKTQATNHPHVYFAPFQNQSQMPRTYAIADLVVLPSYGSGETWGLVINEAMCLAKAVLVSDHVGCAADLVHSHQNGLVFPAGDIPALVESLQIAFADRDRLADWGQQGRRIINNYSYARTTRGLLQAIKGW
jgi:glycosyltransferase involved in cell wall biosynthesis